MWGNIFSVTAFFKKYLVIKNCQHPPKCKDVCSAARHNNRYLINTNKPNFSLCALRATFLNNDQPPTFLLHSYQCLTLHVFWFSTRMFLAARSLCTKLFLDRYSIPEEIWRQYPSSCWGSVDETSSPGLQCESQYMQNTIITFTTNSILACLD